MLAILPLLSEFQELCTWMWQWSPEGCGEICCMGHWYDEMCLFRMAAKFKPEQYGKPQVSSLGISFSRTDMFPTLLPSTWHSCWRLGFHNSNHCSLLHLFCCGCCCFMGFTFLQWKSIVYGSLLQSHLVATVVWEDISRSGLVIIWCFSAAHRFWTALQSIYKWLVGWGKPNEQRIYLNTNIHWTQAGLTAFTNSINRNFLCQYTFENTLFV